MGGGRAQELMAVAARRNSFWVQNRRGTKPAAGELFRQPRP